eukprot:CAMPEP_0183576412 /NCGR_PEP_ID=MMETSP0371-20130417/137627_1 /TAXON_ID=268820 /ORGANISM="Peridinium aciculiferum, Strain PAER-2" /LENGTH=55 /DNA_ID=CAMNT_0025786661 /DNA_START=86 /DNA_END=250 /DNA_ORIENTATION=-
MCTMGAGTAWMARHRISSGNSFTWLLVLRGIHDLAPVDSQHLARGSVDLNLRGQL